MIKKFVHESKSFFHAYLPLSFPNQSDLNIDDY